MGNCLASLEKPIKVMKKDGEIIKYKSPLKVHQFLSEYPGHAISETFPATRYLRPDADMLSGQLYYCLPLPVPSPEFDKKMLRYSNPKEVEGEKISGVLRIKLVITKQELEVMLRKGGGSVDDMISQFQKKESANSKDDLDCDGNRNCRGWKPVLQSIPEVVN